MTLRSSSRLAGRFFRLRARIDSTSARSWPVTETSSSACSSISCSSGVRLYFSTRWGTISINGAAHRIQKLCGRNLAASGGPRCAVLTRHTTGNSIIPCQKTGSWPVTADRCFLSGDFNDHGFPLLSSGPPGHPRPRISRPHLLRRRFDSRFRCATASATGSVCSPQR